MTSTNDSDHGYKWRRPSIFRDIKWGFGALSLIVTISSAAPANADVVTVTLSKMDISVQPVDQPFSVTLSIQRDQNNNVTVDIASITQTFASSQNSLNFDPSKPFPSVWEPPNFGASQATSSNTYAPLPANYPLGGYIDTVGNNIPVEFRPTGGLPIKFAVASAITPSLTYTGTIDNRGRLQFSAPNDYPVDVGTFATLPTHLTYQIGKVPDVTISNFQISLGFSDSYKYNPNDLNNLAGESKSYTFDYGDFNDITTGFYNGAFYTTWADNSAQLRGNSPDQAYKSYAVAKYEVGNFGKTFKRQRIFNLSRGPGGEDLDPNYTYAEGGVTVDPTDANTVVVTYQQRKTSRVGFVLSRSFDGGRTWTKKLLGLAVDPNNPVQPVDPNLPVGGTDEHSRFDRFGGLWISYAADVQAPGSPYGGLIYLVYSADKGETFTLINTIRPVDLSQVPESLRHFYASTDYDFLATGPDATNLNYDTVWVSVGDAFSTCAPNEYQQRVFGLRVKGLGVDNIDLPSLKQYVVAGSNMGAWGSMDVDPSGTVYLSLQQDNVQGTYIELLQDNAHNWLNVLEHGLADDSFSNPRYFALSAFGDCSRFPPQPHNNFILPGVPEIAVDKSSQHPGRVYVVYNNRPNIYSFATRPYLIWSDDKGVTWSNPFSVTDDPSPATKIHSNIAVDPTTGVVAVSWQDARGSADDTEVNTYGVFLDPRELN